MTVALLPKLSTFYTFNAKGNIDVLNNLNVTFKSLSIVNRSHTQMHTQRMKYYMISVSKKKKKLFFAFTE